MFTQPLSPEEQYWVGYMRADGCIIRKPNSKCLAFSQKHEEPVTKFKGFIGSKRPIAFCVKTTNKATTTVYSMSSAIPAYALDDLGVKGTLTDPTLYKSRHFWRGLIDGDGSVILAKLGKYSTPLVACCGKFEDMSALSTWIGDVLGSKPPSVHKHATIFKVNINGRKARYLGLFLYKDQYSALSYKREAALSFETWEPAYQTNGWDLRHRGE